MNLIILFPDGCNPIGIKDRKDKEGIIKIDTTQLKELKDKFKNWKGPKEWFWLFIKMCYYDVGIRIPFYMTPSQIGQILTYQIDNYSDNCQSFLFFNVYLILIVYY